MSYSFLEILIFIVFVFFVILLIGPTIFNTVGYRDGDVTYYIHSSALDPNFKQAASEILARSMWRNHYRITELDTRHGADIEIFLKSRDWLNIYHPKNEERRDSKGEIIRYSITAQSPSLKPRIYIDSENWLYGVPRSGLSLLDYRDYVINHEFGHGLGFDHQKCSDRTAKNGVCPVMYQSTVGCPAGFKCGSQPIDADKTDRISMAYLDKLPSI